MEINVWGARGSYICPQRSYSYYGGNTTCLEMISSGGNTLILDAGSGIIPLGREIIKSNKIIKDFHILLTHTHIDHLQGFPFFMPIYLQETKIHIHCGRWDVSAVSQTFERLFATQYSPIKTMKNLQAEIQFHEMDEFEIYNIMDFQVIPVRTQHTTDTYAYKITDEDGSTFGFITDHEIDNPDINNQIIKEFYGCNLVFHDGQLDKSEYSWQKGWGHSTVEKAIENGLRMNTPHLGIFHHSPDHQDAVIDSIRNDILASYNKDMKISFIREGDKFILPI
ncbi:MAG: MBL fold metallo-hydrolase [Deltaproteobacteria bacterium]|nr:MBL fold metallo-hydrolase [Deltaproteobacteria bacterium]